MLESSLDLIFSFFGAIISILKETISVAIKIGRSAFKNMRSWK